MNFEKELVCIQIIRINYKILNRYKNNHIIAQKISK